MAAGASLVKMGFFMWPIVTGNLNGTTNRRCELETWRNFVAE